jgi:hypothetical protein
MHTHDDNNNNWDTELFKLIEQTSITGRLMFCNVYCSADHYVARQGGNRRFGDMQKHILTEHMQKGDIQ